jgi:hypothetical protein
VIRGGPWGEELLSGGGIEQGKGEERGGRGRFRGKTSHLTPSGSIP